MMRARQVMFVMLLVLLPFHPGRAELPFDEWPGEDLEMDTEQVNEGELRFLPESLPEDSHRHHNRITIHASSLLDGWVSLNQCHQNLDAVPSLQVVYNPQRSRHLRIVAAEGMERAWVEGASVQLRGLSRASRLCVTLQSRALERNGATGYTLRNGPFMRRFLDGYYPMQVGMQVNYPCRQLLFDGMQPSPRPGLDLKLETCGLYFDARFEGRLNTRLHFRPAATGL